MKCFLVVMNEKDEQSYCMMTQGKVDINDLHGYEGVFVRNTVYNIFIMKPLQRFALWFLGFNL